MSAESVENPTPAGRDVATEPAAGLPELPAAAPVAENKRNQHLKVDEPKNKQFTARATETEAARIMACLTAQGGDIVRVFLKMLDYIEADWLQTFKTK